ncbi:putative periplasmic substrate-binding subunit (ABC transporter) [Bradyrhizobium sp. STM 3843]|uniref:ABC transporter substrate-binding protein n=1 Tax=Bradyrhizobium sp. STM 3843 TaxID=551947 RepID=UPI0002403C9D|nr:ABC transporter substrate-binding protein [Bradyrhizobium sp. STM 3843]CCE07869.1 putative periplasmic substrate-binding subunit (ABC transporter) [Bradyrhizobium sp. STM 3843]
MSWKASLGAAALGLAALLAAGSPSQAEVKEVRISKGYGILYLPLIVMEDQKLLEKQAEKAGIGPLKVNWLMLDGGNVINDAMMAGSLDIAGTGAPGFITLWAKAKGIPSVEVVGVSGLSSTSLWMNSNNPEIKSLKDFKSSDKIALPGIKTSLSAVMLQLMVAHEFGRENYAKLDPMTVGLPHPEALAALTSGKTEITAHLTSPPFSYLELKDSKVHRVANSVDILGRLTMDVTFAPKRFVDANPKVVQAFLDALDEADAFIARDKAAAAEIYARTAKVKTTKEEVTEMLEDKDTWFSATPEGVLKIADFMHGAGSIKVKPASWQDLFVPQLRERNGS